MYDVNDVNIMRDDMQQVQQDYIPLIWLVHLLQKCVSMFALDFR